MTATGMQDWFDTDRERWRRAAHVRALAHGGFSTRAIARQVGLSPRQVGRILAGR